MKDAINMLVTMITRVMPCFEATGRKPLLLLAALLGLTVAPAATANPPPSKPSPTNAVVQVPQSVFDLPSEDQTVKDPFFPKSTRFATVVTTRTNRTVTITTDLVLRGLSGRADAPLATVNNITFGVGEERQVRTPTGWIRVRCVEINLSEETVVVEVSGTRRELRFPRRK